LSISLNDQCHRIYKYMNMNSKWVLTYCVEHDFRPYRFWLVKAESESEARLIVCNQQGFKYEETSATTTSEEVANA